MKKRKEHKTFSLDADTYERWEKLMRSTEEDKTLSECIEDSMRQDIEAREGKQDSAPSTIVTDEPLHMAAVEEGLYHPST